MLVPIDEVVHFDVITSDPATGDAIDADSTPTFAVYEESTDTDIGVGGNLTKRTSLTGNYRGSFTASAANGFEAGKWYSVIASATVDTIAGKAVAMSFRCVPAEAAAGVPKVDMSHLNGGSQSAIDLQDFADAGYDPSTNKVQGVVLVDTTTTTTTATNVTTVNGLASNVITAASLASDAGTELGTAVWATTTRQLTDGTNIVLAKGTGVTGFNDLSAAQVNAEVDTALADYDAPTKAELDSGLAALNDLSAADIRTAVGLASANLDTQLDALPTAAENATAVWGAGTRILTAGTNIALAKGTGVTGFNDLAAADIRTAVGLASANLDTQLGALPTAGENADAVWDEAIAGHNTSGSTGEALGAAGAAGDPWITSLPGSYTAGQAGYIIGTNLDAQVSEVGGGSGGSTLIITVSEYYVTTGEDLSQFRIETVNPSTGVATTYDDMTLELFINGVADATVVTFTEIAEGTIELVGTLPTITPSDRLSIKATSVTADVADEVVWMGLGPTAIAISQVVVGRYDDPDADSPNVTWYTAETAKTKSVTCLDADGEPIDLTTYGTFYVAIERSNRKSRTDVQVIEFGDLTISGADDNILTFQANSAVLSEPGDFIWAARQTNESRIAGGRITVTYAPMRDPAP